MSLVLFFGGFFALVMGCSNTNAFESNEFTTLVTHHQILIHNFTFEPKKLVINKGDTVTWINKDFVPHNIMAELGIDEKGEPRLTKYSNNISPDEKFTMTVSNGFDYLCGLHPAMTGKILVKK